MNKKTVLHNSDEVQPPELVPGGTPRIRQHSRSKSFNRQAPLLLAAWPASLLLLPGVAKAGGVVTNCTEAELRAAMAGGGTVSFACDGTITLAKTITNAVDTVVDASGHQITISGGNVRIFYVNSNLNLTLLSLTIANGRSDKGAGIFNAYGRVVLHNCALVNNSAIGTNGTTAYGSSGGSAYGGAVYNLGFVSSSFCCYISNSVVGGNAGWASGGPGGAGGDGCGGALENLGTLTLTDCLLANNSAAGGLGGSGGTSSLGGGGGHGNGSAIANYGTLQMSSCLLTSNYCTGGTGGAGGSGYYDPGLCNGTPGGSGGIGGWGGGALFNSGMCFLVNDTVASNSAVGAQGGGGGSGGPPFTQSCYSGNGGNGGLGGSGYAAIYDANGQCYLTNCTFALNRATPGGGGAGGPAGPYPYPYPPRRGSPGANGSSGFASGLGTTGTLLVNTILAVNSPSNCIGTFIDAGHNLSSDASPGFNATGSLTNTDAKLGPLANNGGPTLTMALLPGSPAIDAGDTSAAPMTDQRGFPRPAGSAADIGAYEYGATPPVRLSISNFSNGLDILGSGRTGVSCRLLISADLVYWTPVATNQFSTVGTILFHDNCSPGVACRFYRLVIP